MNIFALLFVAIAGALNAVQSGSNAQLVRSLGTPWLAALIVSLVTASVFLAALVIGVDGPRLPAIGKLTTAPWWAWIGGLCGAVYVVSTLFFTGRMGAGLFTGLTITAGTLASIVVDHYGWVGFHQHSASPLRIVGAALMVAGLTLVACY